MRVSPAPGIFMDSEICFGKPVIQGTRVPVEIVVGKLAGGMGVDEVADQYALSRADVLAALEYAGRLVRRKRLRPRAHLSANRSPSIVHITHKSVAALQCLKGRRRDT